MRTTSHGFTMIELMVVIAILGILAALAGPSFGSFIASQQVKSIATDLHSDLKMAQSEAIRRSADVTVAASSGGWSTGWTMTVGSTTLSSYTNTRSKVTLSPASGSSATVVLSRNGRASTTNAFTISSTELSNADQARCLRASGSSGIKVSKGTC